MKKIVYVDMDGVLSNYKKRYNEVQQELNCEFPQGTAGFFRSIEMMPGADDAINYLRDHVDIDLYILSSPSYMNPLSYSEKREWIEDKFGLELAKRLILTRNKGLNSGDYLIDDNINGNGQENFSGKLIEFGSDKFRDWPTVIKFLDQEVAESNFIPIPSLNLLVIRSKEYHVLKEFYQNLLGIEFDYHRHGKGPYHYSCELNGVVFEIYKAANDSEVDSSTRLGFRIDDVSIVTKMEELEVVISPKQSVWGFRSIVKDPDGRKIELIQK